MQFRLLGNVIARRSPRAAAMKIAKLLTPARHRHESASGGVAADVVNSEAAIYPKR
jgi:hypothetical protein